LESDVVRVKARYVRAASQLTGGAIDGLNRAVVTLPHRNDGAGPASGWQRKGELVQLGMSLPRRDAVDG
jgi:hypothetical protein